MCFILELFDKGSQVGVGGTGKVFPEKVNVCLGI